MQRSGENDEAILRALEVEWKLEDDPAMAVDPFDVVVTEDLPAHVFGAVRGGTIYVNATGKPYKLALLGDALFLAVVLHHEQYHRLFGPSEPPAYRATLAFLDRIGVRELRPDLIEIVERALRREEAA